MLSQLNIKRCYRTKRDDITNRLLIPALPDGGLYHEKIGLIKDSDGESIMNIHISRKGFAKSQISFYGSPEDAVIKALGIE